MELKLVCWLIIETQSCSLLIVPYGIETYFSPFASTLSVMLLIVPYGIETREAQEQQFQNEKPFNRTLWN